MSVATFVGKAAPGVPVLAVNRYRCTNGAHDQRSRRLELFAADLHQLVELAAAARHEPAPVMPVIWLDTNSVSATRFYRVHLGQ